MRIYRGAPAIDLTGNKFWRLSVIARAGSDGRGEARWLCRCDCGAETTVLGSNLRSGNSKSCGCLNAETRMKHGHNREGRTSSEYRSWQHMRQRCNNTKNESYQDYGGRGIKICEWWNDFGNFLIDMGLKPDPSYQIDRKDVNKGYSKENCRWATSQQNGRNRRRQNNNACGFKGVHFISHRNKYVAQIKTAAGVRCLGYFADSLEAARAYDEAATKYHGEFAATNASLGLLEHAS